IFINRRTLPGIRANCPAHTLLPPLGISGTDVYLAGDTATAYSSTLNAKPGPQTMPTTTENTRWIKDEARRLGFSFVGISRAGQMDEEARRLETWLNKGLHGQMAYMANHF